MASLAGHNHIGGLLMRELSTGDIRILAEAAGVRVPEEDLAALAVRLNGNLELLPYLEVMPLAEVEPVPNLLSQGGE